MQELRDKIADLIGDMWSCDDDVSQECADQVCNLVGDFVSTVMAKRYEEATEKGAKLAQQTQSVGPMFSLWPRIELAEQHGRKHGISELAEDLGIIDKLARKVRV